MVKLADIAREMGVNISVVSRALSDNPDKHAVVKSETREKIRSCAAKMGYQPNRQASFLGKGRCATIFCYLPDFPTRLINDLLFGIAETACTENFPVNFFFGRNAADLHQFLKHSQRNDHTGMLTFPTGRMSPENLQVFREYYENGGKVLFLNTISNTGIGGERPEFKDIPALNIDEYRGGQLAAAHLAELECDEYCLVTLHQGYIYETRERGFADCLARQGKALQMIDFEELRRKRLSPKKRYGFFADCDYLALDCYSVLAGKGGRIGEDVMLCGFDDIFYGRIARPSLSTVHQPTRLEGKLAVEKMVRMIYGAQEKSELIRPHLLVRESTGGMRPDPEHSEWETRFERLPGEE